MDGSFPHLYSDPVVRDRLTKVRKLNVISVRVWVMGEVVNDPRLEPGPQPLPGSHKPSATGADEPEVIQDDIQDDIQRMIFRITFRMTLCCMKNDFQDDIQDNTQDDI